MYTGSAMNRTAPQKRAGIKQIADALGISIGTVDRALHGREGVSAQTRERVLKMARKLNYSPNLAARNLKLNRHFRIGIFLPEQIACFFDPLREGIRTAADVSAGGMMEISFHSYPRLREGDVAAMEAHTWREFDGLILAPGDSPQLSAICQAAEQEKKSLVFVSTDAERLHSLSSIAVEASVSGAIAAELLGQIIPERKPVVVITGDLKIEDHAEKLRGFAAALAQLSPHLSLLPAIESHESTQHAYETTLELLRSHSDLGGIYVSTANSAPVMQALNESGHVGKVKVVATDLFPEMLGWIEAGQIFATLHQRPFTQGRIAFEAISRYLMGDVQPARRVRLAPHIVLRSNVALFRDSVISEGLDPLQRVLD